MSERRQIRHHIRHARRQLSRSEQSYAAQQLVSQVTALPHLAQANAVALYMANDGELDPQPLINWYWAQGAQVYLPVLHPFCAGHLLFLRYLPDTLMHVNAFGMLEPKLDVRLVVPKQQLDIIYTPLVAFDDQGNRLGMGGGFYDRTLSTGQIGACGLSCTSLAPHPVGLAHDCQQVTTLPVASWDVPLPERLTPTQHFLW